MGATVPVTARKSPPLSLLKLKTERDNRKFSLIQGKKTQVTWLKQGLPRNYDALFLNCKGF